VTVLRELWARYTPTKMYHNAWIINPPVHVDAEEIDLGLIAFTLNAEVIYEPLSGYEANIFGSENKAIITVNAGSNGRRQRFSLAHEICHWTNDRGKNLSIECSTSDMQQRQTKGTSLNVRQSREARANTFASELLMPNFMIEDDYKQRPYNLDTVRDIYELFDTSLTSSASRLIQVTNRPAMMILWGHDGKRRWFERSSSLSNQIWPLRSVEDPRRQLTDTNDGPVPSSTWIDQEPSESMRISQSLFNNGHDVVVLLSWG